MNTTHESRWEPEREIPDGITIVEEDISSSGYTDFRDKTITLSSRLTTRERRTVLAHEIVHCDRGPVPDDPLLYILEEIAVDQESTRKLISLTDLLATIAVTTRPDLMAEQLGVTHGGLFTRLEHLTDDERQQIIDAAQRKGRNCAENHDRAHRRSHR